MKLAACSERSDGRPRRWRAGGYDVVLVGWRGWGEVEELMGAGGVGIVWVLELGRPSGFQFTGERVKDDRTLAPVGSGECQLRNIFENCMSELFSGG